MIQSKEGNTLARYAKLAMENSGIPLLLMAQDGAIPGASREERQVGLVARVLVELAQAALYGAEEHVEELRRITELHRAVAGLAQALGVEMPLTPEAAKALANAGRVNFGDATVLTRLLTHYPHNPAWQHDVDELYVWSQA